MATLPTNYVDDQLAESMGGRRHYNMTTDAYGTYLTDVTEYTQRGSTFAAAQINETNTQVNANTTAIADKLSKTGDTQNNTTTFTSDDTTSSPSSFTTISLVNSGEAHSSLFKKMSQAIKNIRWLNNNKRTTGAYDTYRDTVAFTSGDSSDSSATSWTSVSTLSSGLTHATLLNRISTMMKNTRYLKNQISGLTKYKFTKVSLSYSSSTTVSAGNMVSITASATDTAFSTAVHWSLCGWHINSILLTPSYILQGNHSGSSMSYTVGVVNAHSYDLTCNSVLVMLDVIYT